MLSVPLLGCLGSTSDTTGTDAGPPGGDGAETAPELPETLSTLAPVTAVETDGSGTGVWVDEQRDLLLSANGGAGLQVFNISEPGTPTLVGQLGDIYARDVDLMRHDGATWAILAGGGEGIHVVDIADPREPGLVTTADEWGSHNVAVVPGTPYVYDATAVGPQGKLANPVVPVLDLSTPSQPAWHEIEIPATVAQVPTQSDGCHDVVVRVDLGQAFCAGGGSMYRMGGGETFIWDISADPLSPEWVGVIDNPSIVYHHQALASEDGALLFINDEHIAPNCNSQDVGPLEAQQPTAALWVYDISDPTNPALEGYLQADNPTADTPDPDANCGSHFGDLVDGRDAVVWGWYQGGTVLIDTSDPARPVIIDQTAPASGQTWEAEYHAGHVYGSSGNLEVFAIE